MKDPVAPPRGTSRFARRMLLLFLCGALLPMIVLSYLALSRVSTELVQSNTQNMRRTCRAYGMSCLERLLLLDESLAARAEHLSTLSAEEAPRLLARGDDPLSRFRGFAVVRGGVALPGGTVAAPPRFPLDAAARARLAEDRPLAQVVPVSIGPPRVFLMRAVRREGASADLLCGEVDPYFLWSPESIPAFSEVAVVTDGGTVLFSSTGLGPGARSRLQARARQEAEPEFDFEAEDGDYRVTQWELFLRPRFGSRPWTFFVVMATDDILAPVRTFQRTFMLLALLVFWTVCLISVVWIRHGLAPLRALTEGTRRIAARDFSARVDIRSRDEFRQLGDAFNHMATDLGRRFSVMAARTRLDGALLQLLETDAILFAATQHIPSFLPVRGVLIGVRDRHDASRVRVCIRIGDDPPRIRPMRLASFGRYGFALAEPERTMAIPEDARGILRLLRREGIRSIRWLPLGGAVGDLGFLGIGLEDGALPSDEGLEDLRQVAAQITIALSNAQLVERVKGMQWDVMTALARAIDSNSSWTAGHSERVAALSLRIARRLGLPSDDRDTLHAACLLHDIGKLGIPADLLEKRDPLTEEERRMMRSHVEHGVRILEPVADLGPVTEAIRQHHERLDGSGYPRGLVGEQIGPLARILAVADCYDAMTSDRPYRKGLDDATAREELEAAAGTTLDPDVVAVFLSLDPPPHTPREVDATTRASVG